MPEFRKFNKIPRFRREVVITEKIDGTNGLIHFDEDLYMSVGSRNGWIDLTDLKHTDNHGFGKWCLEHEEELKQLGPGYHYGEFYGQGIQRNYGLKEKRFALFNLDRWKENRPACCEVVPYLARGILTDDLIDFILGCLTLNGSKINNFKKPEGIVIKHIQSGHVYKILLENDETPKGLL